MVFCNKCGKENADFTKFCTGCGNNMLVQPAPTQENISVKGIISEKNLCTQCGKENKENAEFCVSCGNSMALSLKAKPQQKNTPIPEIEDNKFVCSQCGKQNKESAKFCIACGNTLPATILEPVRHQTNSAIPESSIHEENEVGKYEKEDQPTGIEEPNLPFLGKKRKKIILWLIGILVLVSGLGAFFLFGNTSGISKDSSSLTNQQDIQSKEETKADVINIPQRKDSAIPKTNAVDSTITISPEIITVKPAASVTTPILNNTNKTIPIETPAAPTLQMAINDLTGQGISKDLVFTKNAKVISYAISKKTIQQCNVVIAFKLENSDVKYTATLVYKNIEGSYVYENNTSQFETSTAKERDISSSSSTSEHNVKSDLINYLKAKKIFGGIKYNDISEIVITKVNNKEYYAESGNTSYLVELTINNISSKCQVNYTIDGKFYVNPLRY